MTDQNINIDDIKKTLKEDNVSWDENAIEPKEYFKILKSKIKSSNKLKLQENLDVLSTHIVAAKKAGQKAFIDRLVFTYSTIIKEQKLVIEGIDKFMYAEDIEYFIDNVKPKGSIKIIELERYPKTIPLDILTKIENLKKKNLFDDFVIVFTDLTNQTYETPEEKKFVEKNRDPVLFGYWTKQKVNLVHERFYYIDDWEDEYCDLTYDKMITKMTEDLKMKNPSKLISQDEKYLNEIVNQTLTRLDKNTKPVETGNFFKNLWLRINNVNKHK